jgi:hypothetical protein
MKNKSVRMVRTAFQKIDQGFSLNEIGTSPKLTTKIVTKGRPC